MLFDKNGFYVIESNKSDYDFAVDIINGGKSTESKYYDLREALRKGNLFPKLYNQYKNYVPRELKVSTEREKCLLEIQDLDFSIADLNLYLDICPNDKDAYELFKCYTEECKKKKEYFTKVFGPLTLSELTDDYEWASGVWPWEGSGM